MSLERWTPPRLYVEAVQPQDEPIAAGVSRRLQQSGQLHLVGSGDCQTGASATGGPQMPVQPDRDHQSSGRTGNTRGTPVGTATRPWRLLVDGERRLLVRPDGARSAPDFTAADLQRRSARAETRNEPLLRALGIRTLSRRLDRLPDVVDATAGYGTDGWLIASLGCQLQMLERSVLMAELLAQALVVARATPATAATAARIRLHCIDATDWLRQTDAPAADVVYIDPMFPPRRKSARVSKDMQFLHELLPDTRSREPDGRRLARLLQMALARAACRVVVKRPRGAPRLDQAEASDHPPWSGQLTTVESPGLRYDVYHTQ